MSLRLSFLSLVLALVVVSSAASAGQTVWTWSYAPAGGESVSAVVTPVLYGKAWAYSIEIDDGGIGTLNDAFPVIRQYHWTDAPPGVAGGNVRTFVAGTSLFAVHVGGNSTIMDWPNVATLVDAGWGVLNHGYWHTGGFAPVNDLSEAEARRELYWSQQIIGIKAYGGQYAPVHMPYPNGYTGFRPYMQEYGLWSGSVAATAYRLNLLSPNPDLTLTPRAWLDESYWTGSGGNPMLDFPAGGPADGELQIDYTHAISPGANTTRWHARLTTIQNTYGANGSDELWCAPTGDVISYYLSRRVATVQAAGGFVTLSIPDNLPGTPLTIRLDNVNPASAMTAPPGGLLYRSGTTAWVTTPMLNPKGSPLPSPHVKLAYSGTFTSHIVLPRPIMFAGIRIHSAGEVAGYTPVVTLNKPDGTSVSLDVARILRQAPMTNGWGMWWLFPTLPDLDPVQVTSIDVAPLTAFKKYEIYAAVLPGDFNNDGTVTQGDYTIWADTYGYDGSPGREDLRADGNGDGHVTHGDYTIWADNFGQTLIGEALTVSQPAAPAVVSEPADASSQTAADEWITAAGAGRQARAQAMAARRATRERARLAAQARRAAARAGR